MEACEVISTEHFTDPHKFMLALRLSDPAWGDGWSVQWVFRGQADANWTLTPSSQRESKNNPLQVVKDWLATTWDVSHIDASQVGGADSWPYFRDSVIHLAAENELVRQFALASQAVGLPTPPLKNLKRAERILKDRHSWWRHWDNETDMELFALAQHHGVPTPLLDWTDHPWTAAYFAARDCFEMCFGANAATCPENISVWALNTKGINEYDGVKIFQPNRADNSFLRAQRGLLTWDRHSQDKFATNKQWISLEDVLALHRDDRPCPVFRKLTLAAQMVPDLLCLLFRENIAEHSMMPWYGSAARLANSVFRWETQRKLNTTASD